MNDDSLKELWATQSVDNAAALTGKDLAKIRSQAADFDRMIWRRDLRECSAGAVIIVLFGIFYLTAPTLLARLGCVVTIMAGAFTSFYAVWKKRRVRPAAADAPVAETLRVELQKTGAQIELLRSVFWWYLLPLGIGPVLFVLGVSPSAGFAMGYVIFVVGFYTAIYFGNKRTIQRTLMPRKRELEMLNGAEGVDESDTKVRMVAPLAALVVTALIVGVIALALFGIGKVKAVSRKGGAQPASLSGIAEKHDVPALAAAFVQDGKVVETTASGLRKAGGSEKVTDNDRFHVGSITKSMTATVAAMLVEQGKLSWTTTIGEALPELRGAIHEGYSSVTLEQLLSHHGGAPAKPPADLWREAWKMEGTPGEQRMRYVKGLLARQPETPPGTKMVYSNQGYAIAGVMMERAAGKPWEELMQTMLFDPLGMTTAGFGAPATSGKVDQPWGHRGGLFGDSAESPGPKADNPPAIAPAGAVHCSIGDLAKYAAFHLAGDRGEGKLLSPESFRKLHTEVGGGYALGWTLLERDWAHGKALWHNGSNTMFYAVVWIAPNRNCAAVAATNSGTDEAFAACDDAVVAMLKKYGILEKK